MAFDTNNPLGSNDFRDLSDNAVFFDWYANGAEPAYPNRFSELKLSINGMIDQFNNAQAGRAAQFEAVLASIGLAPIGDYGAGVTFTTRQQYTIRAGLAYTVANSTTLPFTLTGTWASDEPKLKLVNSDQILRQDLAASNGDTLVGHGATTVGAALAAVEGGLATLSSTVSNLAVRFKVATADTSTLRTLTLADASNLLQLTNPASKVVAIPAQSTVAWVADTAIGLFNDSAAAMQVTGAAGVTLKVVAGGSLNVPKGGLCFVKRLSADVWLVISQVPATTPFTRVKAWGDSITFGVGATSPAFAYINREVEMVKVPFTNYAVSSSTTWDQAVSIFTAANAVEINEASQLMIGTNDSRAYGTADANNLDTFKRAHAALLAWLSIPAVSKINGQDARITYTGSWVNSGGYTPGLVKASSTAGDVASFSFTGTTLYISSSRTSLAGNTAGATVRIDGNVVGTITAKGFTANTLLGGSYGPALYRFGGLTNTTHTVTITVTAAGASNLLFVDWIGVPSASNSRLVNNINIPRQSAAGGGVDATTAAYNTAIADNITMLVGDGLRINLANVTPTFNTATDLAADGLHPNDAGHLKIATLATESLLR